jgi:hypothetical protein
MAVDAYIGEAFVFNQLFVDNTGAPIVMLNPNITIFRFDSATGDTISLVSGDPMDPADPPDPGRYVYRYVVPSNLMYGMTLYADIRATDPVTGFVSVASDTLNLLARSSNDLGLRARFVK